MISEIEIDAATYDRRRFLALPLALVPITASAEPSIGFVISDSFYVIGVANSLEKAKQAAIEFELERYRKYYDEAVAMFGMNKWWRDTHPRLVSTEVRPSEGKPNRWEVWNHCRARDDWYRSQIKIDAVPVV